MTELVAQKDVAVPTGIAPVETEISANPEAAKLSSYPQVCWRDFEAMSTGALLLKPDMSHLRLANDIFKPYETYIPLAWDFSDLAQKAEYYVHNPLERQSVARNAFDVLSQHYRQKRFLRDMAPLWQLLRIN
jgi:spore maturation protein CgeB